MKNKRHLLDRTGPVLSITVNREGNRIHRLIDDIAFPLRASCAVIGRDPLVEALFGSPAAKLSKNKS